MNYCSSCGAPVRLRIPDGDNRPRHVCDTCGVIHYQNPKVVAGCIAEWGDQILLCRRAIEPRYGYWTLPAGFLENGEATYAGTERETLEEANARVRALQLFAEFSLPHIDQVYMLYSRRAARSRFRAWRREHRRAAVRRARDSLAAARVPCHPRDPATLFQGPRRRRR